MGPEDEITCRQFVELVTDYFEGALELRTVAQIEEHLVMCDWCTTYAEQMRETIRIVGQIEVHDHHEHPPAPALLAALRNLGEGRNP